MHEDIAPPNYSRGAPIPWWAKMGLKVVLSRLPVAYATWSRLGAFRHSFLTDANKVVHAARAHVERYREVRGQTPRCVLELGPGELTARAVTYAALGATRIILVDVGDFGANDVAAYQRAAQLTEELGLAPPSLQDAKDRAEIFQRCGTEYLCGGLADLEKIGSGEVDLIVSDAVLEHVRKRDVLPLLAQLRRVAAPDAVTLHGIDFHDHLGGGLQNLRFSDATWEAEWMAAVGLLHQSHQSFCRHRTHAEGRLPSQRSLPARLATRSPSPRSAERRPRAELVRPRPAHRDAADPGRAGACGP